MQGNGRTEGVQTLVGNPRKAIFKLAWPMMFAMSVQTLYNLIGAFWVSGLGVDALSAVGFFFPFFFMVMAIATGIGMGGGAAISRCIGAGDKPRADRVGAHTLAFMLVFSVAMTVPLVVLSRPMFLAMGAGTAIDDTVDYAHIMFSGTVIIFFVNVANSLLWAEGDAKRAMKAMMLGAVINIFLDPVMIYWMDLGVAGAAWATVISLGITASMLFYWLFMKRSTFVSFGIRGFKLDKDVSMDIFRVGLPTSFQQLTMSINMLIMNVIIVGIGGTAGVAVLTAGWRVSTVGILPLMGISTAVVSVCGAAYGMRRYRRMGQALDYAIKMGLAIEIAVALVILFLAVPIAAVFTQSESAAGLRADLVTYFRITWLFLPGVALGMLSGSMFQGAGKGIYSFVVTVLRTVILTPILSLIFIYPLGMGLEGVWWGLVLANITGSTVSYLWAKSYIRTLKSKARRAEGSTA